MMELTFDTFSFQMEFQNLPCGQQPQPQVPFYFPPNQHIIQPPMVREHLETLIAIRTPIG